MKLSKAKNKNTPPDEENHDEAVDELFNISPKALNKAVEQGTKEFNSLLDSLSSLHDKKKSLWKQIYENAVTDRRNAFIMLTDLYQRVHGSPAEHAIHGQNLSKYLERLNKSNEQLIKLAEILDDAIEEDEDEALDSETMYERLKQQQPR